jgi:preprotein translocase subunit SecE
MNNQRYIVLAFVSVAAILGAAVHGIAVPLVARFNLSDPEIIPGIANASSIVSIGLAIAIFITLMRLPSVISYTDDVISELRKVVWPTRDETVRNATIVLGTVLVLSLVLGAYDYVWGAITKVFLYSDT